MIKRTLCRLVLILISLIGLGVPAMAQFEEGKQTSVSNHLDSSFIIAGAVDSIVYSAIPGEVAKKITNVITFKINEQSATFFKSGFTAIVYLKIESWAKSDDLAIQTQYRSLRLNYDSATGAKYDVRAYTIPPPSEKI